MASRIESRPIRIIIRRSIPTPMPPAGGAGRRHAVFERRHEVFIQPFRLVADLRRETLALLQRIVLLCIGRRHFLSVDDQFEHVGARRIVGAGLGQRNQWRREARDKRGLTQRLLDQFFINFVCDQEFVPVRIQSQAGGCGFFAHRGTGQLEPVGPHSFADEIRVGGLAPGRHQADRSLLAADFEGAEYGLGYVRDQILNQRFHAAHVGVGLVDFQHGEFWVVRFGKAFVAEIAVHLEDLVEAAHQQPFQVEFRRDAQVHVHVQRVVMRCERTGGRSARMGLNHGRFHLGESARA